jgi:hypothetical protein
MLSDVLKYRMPVEKFTIAGFGAPVHIRQMSATQAEEFYEKAKEATGSFRTAALLVSMCLCDENGNLLCQQDGENQVMQLGKDAVEELASKAMQVNGLGAKAVEDAAKN